MPPFIPNPDPFDSKNSQDKDSNKSEDQDIIISLNGIDLEAIVDNEIPKKSVSPSSNLKLNTIDIEGIKNLP